MTNNPLVVEIFARTLKKISEEHLTHLSDSDKDSTLYNTNRELFYTGIMASAALSHQPVEPYHASALQMSLQLTIFLQEHKAENEKIIDRKIASLSEYQEESWSDFMVWLDQEKST